MSFSVITQFAALVFLQKWKFVLQREAHSTPSQELLEHSGGGAHLLTRKRNQGLKEVISTGKES